MTEYRDPVHDWRAPGNSSLVNIAIVLFKGLVLIALVLVLLFLVDRNEQTRSETAPADCRDSDDSCLLRRFQHG